MKSLPSNLPGAALCVLLVSCLIAPLAVQAQTVDQVTVASQPGSRPFNPSATFSEAGSALVLWEDSRGGIQARGFGPGAGLAQATQLAANHLPQSVPYHGPVVLQRDPVVVPLQDGEFLAFWKEELQEVSIDILFQDTRVVGSSIQARRFNRVGRPVGRQFALSDGDLGRESAAVAVRLAGGRVAVVWQAHDGRVPAGIYGRLVGGRGVPHGAPFRIDDPTGEAGQRPAVTALEDGGFVVAWQECCDTGGGADVLARAFDADGAALAAPFAVPPASAGDQVWPTVAAGADGELLVAWMGPGAGEEGREYRVYGQRLAGDGTRLGPELVLSSGVGRAHGAPTLARLSDGYALVWTLWLEHFLGGVYGVPLDPAGVPRGDALKLSSGSVRFQWELGLATAADGGIVVTWQGFDSSGRPAINAWAIGPGF